MRGLLQQALDCQNRRDHLLCSKLKHHVVDPAVGQ